MLVPDVFAKIQEVEKQNVTILGATGSIGDSTLKVIQKYPDLFSVYAVSAGENFKKLKELINTFRPKVAVLSLMTSSELGNEYNGTKIIYGKDALLEICSDENVTTVISAIVGVAGLAPTYRAICAGKKIVLANKESIICGAHLFQEKLSSSGSSIIPADSEHCSIFQSLKGHSRKEIESIILTASGGPFRNKSREELSKITIEQAVRHPTWSMGRKISVDSATMMNKALEYLEAHFLFGGIPIEVVIHPQSLIHGGIRLTDGSIITHASVTDMQSPLAYALSFPARLPGIVSPLRLGSIEKMEFGNPDENRFPALALVKKVLKGSSGLPCVFNSANEKAVELFLSEQISFENIELCVEEALGQFDGVKTSSLEEVLMLDSEVKAWVQSRLTAVSSLQIGKKFNI